MRWTAILRTTLWSVLWCFDEPYELLTLNPKLPHSPKLWSGQKQDWADTLNLVWAPILSYG